MWRVGFALATCGMMLGSTLSAPAGTYAPKLGEGHPDFTLPMIDNRTPTALSSFRGKKVLLIQFSS